MLVLFRTRKLLAACSDAQLLVALSYGHRVQRTPLHAYRLGAVALLFKLTPSI